MVVTVVSHGSSGTWLQHPRTFQFDLVGLDMALIDFFQVVELYKLRCADGCFLPIDPDPLPMSAPPPRPSTPLFGSHRVRIGTPKRIASISRSRPGPTPPNRGSSSRKGQEGDTDRDEKYAREDYDNYIREDLNSRVFVDFEVFLKSVLHAPNDWKTQWNPAIEKVKTNENFKAHHKKYCQQCEEVGALETMFYRPLADTANAVLDVVSWPEFKDISDSGNPQYYQVYNKKSLRGGVMSKKNLSPDLVVLHKDLKPVPGKNLRWANALHVLEVKPSDAAICDGMNMPRLIVDGKSDRIVLWFIITNIEDRSRSDFKPCPPPQPGTIPVKRVHSPHRPRTYPGSVIKATLCGAPFRESASLEKTQDRIRVDRCQ